MRQAQAASFETQPVMAYYGLLFLAASFQRMLFLVRNPTDSHGLAVKWPSKLTDDNASLVDESVDLFLNGISVRVSPHGAFARIRDLLSLSTKIGWQSVFSRLSYDSTTGELASNTAPFASIDEVATIPLKQLVEFDYETYPDKFDIGTSEFLFDLAVLFIASSMARYRPTIWRLVSAGVGGLLPDILACLRRANQYPPLFYWLMESHGILSRDRRRLGMDWYAIPYIDRQREPPFNHSCPDY